MIFKIFAGIALLLLGLTYFGVAIPEVLLGIAFTVGGIALLAGI